MKKHLGILFIALLTITLAFLSLPNIYGDSAYSTKESDQVLYFQPTATDAVTDALYINAWALGTNMPNTHMRDATVVGSQVMFVSPPLAQNFTFQTVVVTIYHDEITSDGYELKVNLYHFVNGHFLHYVTQKSKAMNIGSTSTSISVNFNTSVLEQERIGVAVQISTYVTDLRYIHWGNSTYPSQISYEGSVAYVPEFQSFFFLGFFTVATLFAVVIIKKTQKREVSIY